MALGCSGAQLAELSCSDFNFSLFILISVRARTLPFAHRWDSVGSEYSTGLCAHAPLCGCVRMLPFAHRWDSAGSEYATGCVPG